MHTRQRNQVIVCKCT